MKVWRVELKERNTPAKNLMEAPLIETEYVAAKNCAEAEKKTANRYLTAVEIELVAETRG